MMNSAPTVENNLPFTGAGRASNMMTYSAPSVENNVPFMGAGRASDTDSLGLPRDAIPPPGQAAVAKEYAPVGFTMTPPRVQYDPQGPLLMPSVAADGRFRLPPVADASPVATNSHL